jgi:transcriptional regulator with XRE-family HTH domain
MQKGRLPKSLYSPTYERFLSELRKARMASGVTQVQAAERLGRPQSFISKCESGERRIDVAEFLALCEAFGTDPFEIIRTLLKSPILGRSAKGKPKS